MVSLFQKMYHGPKFPQPPPPTLEDKEKKTHIHSVRHFYTLPQSLNHSRSLVSKPGGTMHRMLAMKCQTRSKAVKGTRARKNSELFPNHSSPAAVFPFDLPLTCFWYNCILSYKFVWFLWLISERTWFGEPEKEAKEEGICQFRSTLY